MDCKRVWGVIATEYIADVGDLNTGIQYTSICGRKNYMPG